MKKNPTTKNMILPSCVFVIMFLFALFLTHTPTNAEWVSGDMPIEDINSNGDDARRKVELLPRLLFSHTAGVVCANFNPSFTNQFIDSWVGRFQHQLSTESEAASAIEVLLASLGDQRWEFRTTTVETNAPTGKVGLAPEKTKDGNLFVRNVMRLFPASLAGVHAGDLITEINGAPCPPSLSQCIVLLRGEPNTTVKLKIIRKDEALEAVLRRTAEVYPKEIVCTTIGPVAYLRPLMGAFSNDEIPRNALKKLATMNVKGLILDLRDNDINTALYLNALLPEKEGQVFYIDRYNVNGHAYETHYNRGEPSILPALPVCVLTNRASTYMAEVTAGALKHYSRATLVGDSTGGKASHLRVYPLDKNHDLVYPKYLYKLPSGNDIEGVGVAPDVLVPDSSCGPDDGPWFYNIKPGAVASPTNKDKAGQIADKQLRAAVSVLLK